MPGIQTGTALVLFGELGPDFVNRFPTAKCFASWLGLCPDNRITGGRILSVKTRDVKSRAAEGLGLGAQALWQSKTYLGDCFRRWKARLGSPKAITALAHKLARIIWHFLEYQEPYDPSVWARAEEKNRQKKIKRFEKTPPPSASNSSLTHELTSLVSQEAAWVISQQFGTSVEKSSNPNNNAPSDTYTKTDTQKSNHHCNAPHYDHYRPVRLVSRLSQPFKVFSPTPKYRDAQQHPKNQKNRMNEHRKIKIHNTLRLQSDILVRSKTSSAPNN